MNTEHHSLGTTKIVKPIQIDLDEFQISEETFKPMTKGLGFHQETKKASFKSAPKEVKTFAQAKTAMAPSLAKFQHATAPLENSKTGQGHLPSGLEAFYNKSPLKIEGGDLHLSEISSIDKKETMLNELKLASPLIQLFAWIVDILVISSFVILTGVMLILASGIEFNMYSRLISNQDLLIFTSAIFSIYYVLYFTILELTSSPGKTIFGLRLVKSDFGELSVKNTFIRSIVALFSGVALFLPMLLDFQGRLSDTKVVK
jgi:uncharacterized RDD family membrane protein YckC